MLDGLHDIGSSPVVSDQGVLQREGSVSGASNTFTHRCAAQLKSYLVNYFTQILLRFI